MDDAFINLPITVLFHELAKTVALYLHSVAVNQLRQVTEIFGIAAKQALLEGVELKRKQMLERRRLQPRGPELMLGRLG